MLLAQSLDAILFLLCKAGRKEKNSSLCFKPESVINKSLSSLIAFAKSALGSFLQGLSLGVRLSTRTGLSDTLSSAA